MGVRILHDQRQDMACMYDSVSGFAFGPAFSCQITIEGEKMYGPDGDAGERCLSFARYIREHGADPRSLTDSLLERMLSDWAAEVTVLGTL